MKRLIPILVLIAIAAAGWFGYQNVQQRRAAEAQSSIQTTPVERGELTASVGATGVVRANQTAVLTWLTSGTVESVEIAVGDQVTAGQALARLEQTTLPQNVILAQADLVSAQQAMEDLTTQAEANRVKAMQEISTYEQAVKDAQYALDNFTVPVNQANLDTVEALDLMKNRLEQARQAFEPVKYASSNNTTRERLKEDLDNAQSDYNTAVRRLELEYNVQVANANLERAHRDYDRWKDGPSQSETQAAQARIDAAQAALSQREVTAPFSGIVTEVLIKPGDLVAPGATAFRLDDLNHLLLDVQVSEVDINRIRVGQSVSLSFDAITGQEYQGQVIEVSQVGTSDQGVVDFTVTVELTNADENVRPGMTAAVNIVVEQLEGVLMVPNRAVRVQNGQRVVYVLRNNVPTAEAITLGSSSDTMSEVVEGNLKEGDPIVLNPPTEFEQGGGPPAFMRR